MNLKMILYKKPLPNPSPIWGGERMLVAANP